MIDAEQIVQDAGVSKDEPGRRLLVDLPPDPASPDSDRDQDDAAEGSLIDALGVRGWSVPPAYEVYRNGMYVSWTTRSEVKRVKFAYGPVLPTLVQVDSDGRHQVQISWVECREGRYRARRRIVDRSTFVSGRRLIAELGDYGLPVVDDDAKRLERWLLEVLSDNRVPHRYVARQLGWQPDGAFVVRAGEPHPVEPRFPEQAEVLGGFRVRGTLDGWRTAVEPLRSYPAACMPLYGSLAAPLLRPLRAPSTVLDLSGRSTRGKTTSLRIAVSPWGDPGEDSSLIGSWRTTMLGIEYRLHLGYGMPAVLDDTRTAAEGLVDQVLYQVSQGRGKSRGGGWANALPWQTILLSTGEQAALSMCTHEGASARVLSISTPPFGVGGADSARAADLIRDGIEANHGTAGPAFVEQLRLLLATPDGAEMLRRRWADLTAPLLGDSDISARRARNLGVLVLAAHLAYEWGIVPFPPPAVEVWRDLFSAQAERDDRSRRAIDLVAGWVAANRHALWVPKAEHRTPPSAGWIGRLLKDPEESGRHRVGLMVEPLRRELRRSGVELDAVLHGWMEDGHIIRSKSRPFYSDSKPVDGTKARLIIFSRSAVEISMDGDEE